MPCVILAIGFHPGLNKDFFSDTCWTISMYIEGVSKEEHRWESEQRFLEKHDHPLWKKFESQAEGSGHGGMDFFILRAFIESLKVTVNLMVIGVTIQIALGTLLAILLSTKTKITNY